MCVRHAPLHHIKAFSLPSLVCDPTLPATVVKSERERRWRRRRGRGGWKEREEGLEGLGEGVGGEGQGREEDGGKMRGVNREGVSERKRERERDGRRSICHHGCNGAESIQERG